MSCNLSCKFCFKTSEGFLNTLPENSASNLTLSESREVLEILFSEGFEKITFAGGEPTLYPYLPEIMTCAKEIGFTVMLVTNGHRISDQYLDKIVKSVDAIKISIDSPDEITQLNLGRGKGDHVTKAVEASLKVKAHNIPLMINTVVTSLNYQQDMSPIIELLKPVRWKVFQVLRERGENDHFQAWCTDAQFQEFVFRHEKYSPVAESNDLMRGSYVMMDPIGRFMQDLTGGYLYSKSILQIGVEEALREVGWDAVRFLKRGGLYQWKFV